MNQQPIDPDIVTLLAELGPPVSIPLSEIPAEDLRQGMRATIALFTQGVAPIEVDHVDDQLVPGRDGSIPVRVYRPQNPTSVIVYMHGGGWVIGGIDTHDLLARRLSRDTGAVVVSVEYRMLPEHPFPAPIDDAYDAIVWASALLPGLPFVVAGDSAGGTLAACAALRARDEDGPHIDAQVLVYPGVDDDFETPSMLAYRDGPMNTLDGVKYFIQMYACTDAALGSPYALPARATSLAGLPPAIVAIAAHDLLRTSVEAYAARLQDAGVPVVVQFDPELTHSWIDFAPRVPSADRAFTRLTDSINELISSGCRSA